MSPIFRPGRVEDVSAVARLGSHSFPAVPYTLEDWERILQNSPRGGVENMWVGEVDGRVVASCQLYPLEQYIGGRAISTMGLGAVTIAATARRQGLASALTTSALRRARERGDVASALYPFRTSFYRKLGYGIAGEVHQFRIPPRALPDHPGRRRVTLVETSEDRAAVAGVYARWAPLQTGQMVRSERGWEPVWQGESRHGALHREEGGNPTGYIVFRYHTDAERGGRMVEVEEIAWLDREARLGLYGWLSSLSDQWDHILYRAHPEEAFPEHLDELRYPLEGIPRWHFWFASAALSYGPMFRLLDPARAWGMRTVHPEGAATVALEVHDPQIPENSRTIALRMRDGRTEEMGERESARCEVTMRVDIEALSRIFIGSLTPSAAVLAGLARVDRPERLPDLDHLLRLPRPWTFDRF